ncbi:MAG: bacteriohemerythrin [Magnetovibrio sp.]|nr:bacteriohemerythrin [Magnetovibrio sp.]
MLVQWTKELETGVTFVDADHKVLINLLNQVNHCIVDNEDLSVLGSVLDALVEYTDYHFLREEKMMELSGYSGIETHKITHRVLSGQVRAVYDDYQNRPEKVNAVDVRDFLQSWLVDHIMGSDFAYRDTCLDNAEAAHAAGQVGFLGDGSTFNEWEHIRIMLVDDNPNFRRLVRTILRAVGIRNIQVVETPLEGIARLADRPADIVLCDWVMDEMNGTEFAHKVSEMQLPTRVVMLTGYSIDVLKERSSDLGIADYIEKPVKARTLLETISRVAMAVPQSSSTRVA